MHPNRLLASPDALRRLAQRLEACSAVTKFNTGDHNEAWTLVHSLSDLESSFHDYLERFLPGLLDASIDQDEVLQRLLELIGELRHVQYHLQDSKFIRYHLEPTAATE